MCYNIFLFIQEIIMTHTLSMDEYYDVVLKNVEHHKPTTDISGLSSLVLGFYAWVNDFTDRRGIRHTWDQEMAEQEQNDFFNNTYKLFENSLNGSNIVTLTNIEVLTEHLKTIPGMTSIFDGIDDDIIEEMKATWLTYFHTTV